MDRRRLFRMAGEVRGAVGAFPAVWLRRQFDVADDHDCQHDATTNSACTVIPNETEGPYPGDGSNGPERAHPQRRRAQRHPFELRRPERNG